VTRFVLFPLWLIDGVSTGLKSLIVEVVPGAIQCQRAGDDRQDSNPVVHKIHDNAPSKNVHLAVARGSGIGLVDMLVLDDLGLFHGYGLGHSLGRGAFCGWRIIAFV